jgi:transcription elongation factor GreA
MRKIPITRAGLDKLRQELGLLERVERPKNIRAIEEARGHGDLSENAEFHAAKERQAFLESKINELKTVIGQSEVIDADSGPADRAVFGRTVALYDVETEAEIRYQLVGPYESDPERGRISVDSPIGQALVGREAGETVRVKTPRGVHEFEIVGIS